MGYNDLTSLYAAVQWLGQSGTGIDALIQRMISSASLQILNYLNRDSFVNQQYDDVMDGAGRTTQMLKNYPVTAITTLLVDNVNYLEIPEDTGGSDQLQLQSGGVGYRYKHWTPGSAGSPVLLEARGFWFTQYRMNVRCVYNAGYLVDSEAAVIPATPFKYTTKQPYGAWIGDSGVFNVTDNIAMTPVTTAPNAGEYQVIDSTDSQAPGVYLFNTADAGKSIKISYSYAPFVVEQVCLEVISERLAYRNKPGLRQVTNTGAQSATYGSDGLTDGQRMMLQNYVRTPLID